MASLGYLGNIIWTTSTGVDSDITGVEVDSHGSWQRWASLGLIRIVLGLIWAASGRIWPHAGSRWAALMDA